MSKAAQLNSEGIKLFEQGDFEGARAKFEEAVKLEPDNPEFHGNLGEVYEHLSLWDKALEEFLKVIELNPEDMGAHEELAQIYLEKEIFYKALFHLKYILRNAPDIASENEIPAQIEYVERVMNAKLESTDVEDTKEAHCEFADKCLENGLTLIAIDEYKKALEYDPDYIPAHLGLSKAYFNKYLDKEAEQEIKKAIELNPDNPELHKELGEIYFENEKFENALSEFKLAEKLGLIDDIEVIEFLGDVYMKLNDKQKAREYYKKCEELDPDYFEEYEVNKKLKELED